MDDAFLAPSMLCSMTHLNKHREVHS